MPVTKALKKTLFPAANIILALFLLVIFYRAAQNVSQTFVVADMTAINNLRPDPINYISDLNFHRASLDTNRIRYFADYYEHLLRVFPGMRDAYGLLGYLYHYLKDDPKAIEYLKKGIGFYPDYFWNYYDLAVIYMDESRYEQADVLLRQAMLVEPKASFKRMLTSSWIYLPLLGSNESQIVTDGARHLGLMYKTSFILDQILRHVQDRQKLQAMIGKMHPEVYAF